MGAGLQHNLGHQWGQLTLSKMTGTENSTYKCYSQATQKKREIDSKRKATNENIEKYRKSIYAKLDDSAKARKAYSRHDNGIVPEDVTPDISPEYLEQLKISFYENEVSVQNQQIQEIELNTPTQNETAAWMLERLERLERQKRITASNIGEIVKMRKSTKWTPKIQSLLYSSFKGTAATKYGTEKEPLARERYKAQQLQNNHLGLKIFPAGLVISHKNPWLAASPDDYVYDPSTTESLGLVEYKNPVTARSKSILEFTKQKASCLRATTVITSIISYSLKKNHKYYYQVQCQMYCTKINESGVTLYRKRDSH